MSFMTPNVRNRNHGVIKQNSPLLPSSLTVSLTSAFFILPLWVAPVTTWCGAYCHLPFMCCWMHKVKPGESCLLSRCERNIPKNVPFSSQPWCKTSSDMWQVSRLRSVLLFRSNHLCMALTGCICYKVLLLGLFAVSDSVVKKPVNRLRLGTLWKAIE